MSLYQLSKLLYVLNRDDAAKARFVSDPEGLARGYQLTDEERDAFLSHDIGLLYVLGVNGQILMHFAPLCGIAWADYLQMMRDGVTRYGPVRDGIYAMTTTADEKVAGV
ncbi:MULTISPECIES: aromatic ring-opening dioxygenase subunit LigA [unclassified Sphingomonas]|uniref:aromatic ring-opening dioxygenase subunit LigA n=1 Tax=Novosphingobium rhizosphaerae TaxID=1551649 RepID=UPI0015C7A07C